MNDSNTDPGNSRLPFEQEPPASNRAGAPAPAAAAPQAGGAARPGANANATVIASPAPPANAARTPRTSPVPYMRHSRPAPSVTNATVPGVAPPGRLDDFQLPRVLPDLTDFNATVPDDGPPSSDLGFGKRGSSNATVPGLGVAHPVHHNTEPMSLPLVGPGPGVASGHGPGLPPASDPFVENAITAPAPLTPKSGAPSPGALGRIPAPPPDPDDLVRGLEKDRSAQTPVAHVAESRGRDGASHAAIVQPAPSHVERPPEPLVVVDVGTDPTSRSVTAVLAPPPPTHTAISEVPRGVPRTKARVIVMLGIFGVCLMLALGILGTLAAKYFPGAAPQAGPPKAGHGAANPPVTAKSPTKGPAVASPALSAAAAPAGSAHATAPASAAPAAEDPEVPSSAAPARPAAPRSNAPRPSKPATSPNVRHANELERGID